MLIGIFLQASVLGKRIGRLKWPNSSKTLFGTASFIVTIAASALSLRALGIVEHFSVSPIGSTRVCCFLTIDLRHDLR